MPTARRHHHTNDPAAPGALIGALRRRRRTCIYCDRPPATWEHIVPEAIGGKLTAFVLCEVHQLIEADHRFAERFAPMTHLMEVQRQDGRVGAAMMLEKADGSGRARLFDDGAMEIPTDVVRDDEGRFVRVTGEITHIPKLRKQIAGNPADYVEPATFQLVPEAPELVADFGFGPETWPSVVKIALHFVASFDAGDDAPREIVDRLRPIIYGGPSTPDSVTVTSIKVPYFTAGLDNAHEVACFDGGDHATIAVSLYGIFRCLVRLDGTRCTRTLRYVQRLGGEPPELRSEDLLKLPWTQANEREQARWLEETKERVQALINRRINVFYDKKVREALPKAYGEFSRHAFNYKSPIEGIAVYLRAELEQTIPNREDLEIVMREALANPDLLDKVLKDAVVIGRNRGELRGRD